MLDVLSLLWLADGWRHGVGRVGGGRLDPRQDRQSRWHREPLSLALSLSLSLGGWRLLSRFVHAVHAFSLSGSVAKGW